MDVALACLKPMPNSGVQSWPRPLERKKTSLFLCHQLPPLPLLLKVSLLLGLSIEYVLCWGSLMTNSIIVY
jgi:hypothetical protein